MSSYRHIKNAIKRKQRNIKHFQNFKRWFKLFPVFYSLFLIIVTIIIISGIVWLFANLEWFELKSKNELGDAFGGLTNPIVAFIGVIVTFLAFYIQYTFNKEQSKLIAIQRKERIDDKRERDIEIRREQFDRKFYELLQLHSENVKEFNIDNKIYGRKCFVSFEYEFRIIYSTANYYYYFKDKIDKKKNVNIDVFKIAFNIFINGVSNDRKKNRFLVFLPKIEEEFYENVISELKSIQDLYYIGKDSNNYFFEEKNNHFIDLEFFYYPFDGHIHRLEHYFRHVFNLIKIIDNNSLLSVEEKEEYVDIFRAQLSTYEQLIIYFHIASESSEEDWLSIVKKYRLIYNLPLFLTLGFKDPNYYFKDSIDELRKEGKKMFEWVKLENEEK